MPAMQLVSRQEAQKTRTRVSSGVRVKRRAEFDAYVQAIQASAEGAAIFTQIEGDSRKFVTALRAAFKRNGIDATVRKAREKDEVKAWLNTDDNAERAQAEDLEDEEEEDEEDEEDYEDEEDEEDE